MPDLNDRIVDDAWASLSTAWRYRSVLEHMGQVRINDISELELGRIQATVSMVPRDVAMVLDVGRSDGRIAQRLLKPFKVPGCRLFLQFRLTGK